MALRLFVPPRFHVGEREEHRKATWLELFYDLVYVATIVQLGNFLSDNVSLQGAFGIQRSIHPDLVVVGGDDVLCRSV